MPWRSRTARRTVPAWSALPALLATGLLAAGIGGADHVTRAEKAVAARLSWCGVNEQAVAVAQARWQGQSNVAGRMVDVVAIPVSVGGPAGSRLTVTATPKREGGWRIEPADAATAAALGDCLDGLGD